MFLIFVVATQHPPSVGCLAEGLARGSQRCACTDEEGKLNISLSSINSIWERAGIIVFIASHCVHDGDFFAHPGYASAQFADIRRSLESPNTTGCISSSCSHVSRKEGISAASGIKPTPLLPAAEVSPSGVADVAVWLQAPWRGQRHMFQ